MLLFLLKIIFKQNPVIYINIRKEISLQMYCFRPIFTYMYISERLTELFLTWGEQGKDIFSSFNEHSEERKKLKVAIPAVGLKLCNYI